MLFDSASAQLKTSWLVRGLKKIGAYKADLSRFFFKELAMWSMNSNKLEIKMG